MKPPATIKKHYLVEKRNILNEIQTNDMTLQEIRFFCIYLSKINARDPKTSTVRFTIEDFQSIMELGRANYDSLRHAAHNLLRKLAVIPKHDENFDGEKALALFITCKIKRNQHNGEGYVEITAHPEAMPLLFEYKSRYFSYEIWNALRLKSANQIRMYEILKQYEYAGERILPIGELKSLLGLQKNEYSRYNNFRARVLESCREALTQYTDIKFSYEPYGRRQHGGKVAALKFTIDENKEYENPLTYEEFVERHGGEPRPEPELKEGDDGSSRSMQSYEDGIRLLSEACDGKFSRAQIEALYPLVYAYYMQKPIGVPQANFLSRIYLEVKASDCVRSSFGYVREKIKRELNERFEKTYLDRLGLPVL